MAKTNFVIEGWKAFHRLALDLGASIEYDPFEYPELGFQDIVDEGCYKSFISPIDEICRIDFDQHDYHADSISNEIMQFLKNSQLRNPGSWAFFVSVESAEEIFEAFKQSSWRSKIPIRNYELPINFCKSAIDLLRAYDCNSEEISPILWGLALIGAVKFKINRQHCKFCFRRAYQGSPFCNVHTQKDIEPEIRSLNAMNYRIGRKVYALANERNLLEKIQYHRKVLDASSHTLHNFFNSFFFVSLDGNDSELDIIHYVLQQSPNTFTRIGGKEVLSFTYENLLQVLRSRLDENEWDDLQWVSKILAAEVWFALEEEVTPGKRGRGRTASNRIFEAQILSQEGCSKKEIATRLGVTPSAISKWLKRNPGLKGLI